MKTLRVLMGQRRPSGTLRSAPVSRFHRSRALSDPQRVHVRTRERLERIDRELGYVPNTQARGLTPGELERLPFLWRRHEPLLLWIIRGAEFQRKAARYTQVLVDTKSLQVSSFTLCSRCADRLTVSSWRHHD